MQVSTYIAPSDYETLAKFKPAEMTVPQFMADILRTKAKQLKDQMQVTA